MMPIHSEDESMRSIATLRNDYMKDFLDERHLIAYLSSQYRRLQLSSNLIQNIRDELKQLLFAPVDEQFYELLIHQVREHGEVKNNAEVEFFFRAEIDQLLKKHF
jgi:hypothetical protein